MKILTDFPIAETQVSIPIDKMADDAKQQLMDMLTRRVRILTVDQIARTWWSHTVRPKSNAMKQLRKLEADGLIEIIAIMARPEIELAQPVFRWQPGDPNPDFGPIAYQLRARWRKPLVSTPAIMATRQANRLYGGYTGGRRPRPSEATHDVHLAQVYLRLRETRPELTSAWVSEAQQYAEGGGKNERLPDAIIRDADAPRLLVEFAGSYSKQKLQAFHDDTNNTPYELW